MAFQRTSTGGMWAPTPQRALGTICHSVLEVLVGSGDIATSAWESRLETAWRNAIEKAQTSKELTGDSWAKGDPRSWPGYAIKRARLRKTAGRLRELLAGAGEPAELLCEQACTALSGQLVGRPDLIVRSPKAHWVVDYKSGEVLRQDGHEPRDSYVRQLQLYAVLEHERSGGWPTNAYLVPLTGPIINVPIHPEQCEAMADEMLADLEAYNARVPEPQHADPGPDTCRWCPYAARCAAFWDACDQSWRDGLLAVRGNVRAVVHTKLGGATVLISRQTGSAPEAEICLRNVAGADHPAIAGLSEGTECQTVGLRRISESGTYELPPWGQLVWSEAT
jgi:CRISPR/Cas system-associated exonuclease Cas4 (RecB family)